MLHEGKHLSRSSRRRLLIASHDRLAGDDVVTEFCDDLKTFFFRQKQFGARSEFDHAQLFASGEFIAGFEPADDAAGEGSGDLTDDHAAVWRFGIFEAQSQTFVFASGFRT